MSGASRWLDAELTDGARASADAATAAAAAAETTTRRRRHQLRRDMCPLPVLTGLRASAHPYRWVFARAPPRADRSSRERSRSWDLAPKRSPAKCDAAQLGAARCVDVLPLPPEPARERRAPRRAHGRDCPPA